MSLGTNAWIGLPPEAAVLARNRAITSYYAQLYAAAPQLFKWAGVAAFASFHIGKRLELWDWEASGIRGLAEIETAEGSLFEDDFQIIRIINNEIFGKLGQDHVAFMARDFEHFDAQLSAEERHPLVRRAFEDLDEVRRSGLAGAQTDELSEMTWRANTSLLAHEQARVVQPLFDRLSDAFSGAMTFLAAFDYGIHERGTRWVDRSRFILFMLLNPRGSRRRFWELPDITELDQRWCWIERDVLPRWRKAEKKGRSILPKIEHLIELQDQRLTVPAWATRARGEASPKAGR